MLNQFVVETNKETVGVAVRVRVAVGFALAEATGLFGLLVALNLPTAFLSPPVAMAAFYLKGVAPKHVTLNQIFAGMLPFMGIQVVAIFLLYVFPEIGLWLPQVLYK